MADVHEPEVRSYNMSRIRSKDTKPEMIVRKFLHAKGYRYRHHDKTLPGKPDLVFKKCKTAIFVHGCFWHGHEGCRYFVVPKTRTEWWLNKIGTTVKTDQRNLDQLIESGWNTLVIWECQLKPGKREATLEKLLSQINKK